MPDENATEAKSTRGRKEKYDKQRDPIVARAMARLGATEQEIADALDTTVTTLNAWKKRHPEFLAALKEGKDVANSLVEDSLYKRAMGYRYTETEIVEEAGKVSVVVTRGKNKGKTKLTPATVIRTKTLHKSVAPDVTAQIFWLCNRQPERWRNVSRHEHTGPNGGPIAFRDLSSKTDQELADIAEGKKPR